MILAEKFGDSERETQHHVDGGQLVIFNLLSYRMSLSENPLLDILTS